MLHHIQKLAQTDQRLYVRAKAFTTKHESLWSWIRQSRLRCDMKNSNRRQISTVPHAV